MNFYEAVVKFKKVNTEEAYNVFFWEAEKSKASVIFSIDMDKANVDTAISYIKDFLEKNYDVCSVQISEIKEITTGRFHQLGTRGDHNVLIRRFMADESDMGMDSYKTSLHMVFMGNPGTAKTTVVRLITQIFAKEG